MVTIFSYIFVGQKFCFNGAVYQKTSGKRAKKLEGVNPGKYSSFKPDCQIYLLIPCKTALKGN